MWWRCLRVHRTHAYTSNDRRRCHSSGQIPVFMVPSVVSFPRSSGPPSFEPLATARCIMITPRQPLRSACCTANRCIAASMIIQRRRAPVLIATGNIQPVAEAGKQAGLTTFLCVSATVLALEASCRQYSVSCIKASRSISRCKSNEQLSNKAISQQANSLPTLDSSLITITALYQAAIHFQIKMFFAALLSILLLSASAYAQQDSVESSNPDQGTAITVTELDTSEPTLWQMAAFAARSMSTKQRRFKLATLTAAEQIDSLYRLKVTLQRVNQGAPIDKNDLLYCTVEVRTNGQGQQWEVDNFGCTLPAVVRRRRPQKKVQRVEQPTQPIELTNNKFQAPVDNSISDNKIDSEEPKKQFKRQTRPFYLQQVAYQQPRFQYLPVYPQYPVYYQTTYY